MKKNLIIFSATFAILSLLFFSFTNWNTVKADPNKSSNDEPLNLNQNVKKDFPDLYFGVDTRFAAIKKSDIDKATTIYDFLNEGEKQQIVEINSVKVVKIEDNRLSGSPEYGNDEHLTDAQIKLIRSTDYFNHFTIRTEFIGKNKDTGKLENRFFGPHITIVPDQQALYVNGKDALLKYLEDNSYDALSIIDGNKLGAIKISFIITKKGEISNVKHDAMTTSYPTIDEKLIELIKNIPGEWTPAETALGEKIDYEFVFTFGPRDRC
ncbi:hypothetical protein [Psychroserpens ponticola]|uniref:TonB C-terminal domain-containing protein n=1 Tax=Psychroserpens ponticola TaxID=2932268 RepID=A0ABY7RVI4_9FLAO|nr:hypothetical protein [Psychroserpens ponticola]WCO00934.1 hypothetical protein MUN68_012755 [Psychroserpens ponticola]